MDYRMVTNSNVEMIEVTPINCTGIAEAYCSTRHGGVSKGPTASMSVNIYKKFDVEAGQENFRIFCNAIGVNPNRVITNRLIYGTDVVRCVNSSDIIDIYDDPQAPHADGLVTDDPSITLFLYAADCAIVQFVDVKKKVVACCHAGWKGSLCGIIGNTVEAMKNNYGCLVEDIVAVILPSIGQCCFEVGEEVAVQFRDAGFSEYIDQSKDKPHIDLFGVNSAILRKAGLTENNIHKIELCTYCNEELFHSFRRGPVENQTKPDGKQIQAHLNGMNGMFIRLSSHK